LESINLAYTRTDGHLHFISVPRSGVTVLTELMGILRTSSKRTMYSPFHTIPIRESFIQELQHGHDYVIKSHAVDQCNFASIDYGIYHNIRLLRRNLVESCLSLALARTTGQWGWNDYSTQCSPIVLADAVIENAVVSQIQSVNSMMENTYNIEYANTLFYEDIPWHATVKEIIASVSFDKWHLPFLTDDINGSTIQELGMNTQRAHAKFIQISNEQQAHELCLKFLNESQTSELYQLNQSGVIVAWHGA